MAINETNNGCNILNHLELLSIHEASRECIRLRSMIQYIQKICVLSSIKNNLTILYEDNTACIAQIKYDFIKVIGLSIFHQNSFIHMSFKRMVIEIFNKYAQVTILQIYLQNSYKLQH